MAAAELNHERAQRNYFIVGFALLMGGALVSSLSRPLPRAARRWFLRRAGGHPQILGQLGEQARQLL